VQVNPWVVLVPVLVAAAGFAGYCLFDLAHAQQVRYLPKWAWAILCMGLGLSIPWGGILYLTIGKVRSPKPRKPHRPAWPMWRSTGGTPAES
jgi:hypothetical protein